MVCSTFHFIKAIVNQVSALLTTRLTAPHPGTGGVAPLEYRYTILRMTHSYINKG